VENCRAGTVFLCISLLAPVMSVNIRTICLFSPTPNCTCGVCHRKFIPVCLLCVLKSQSVFSHYMHAFFCILRTLPCLISWTFVFLHCYCFNALKAWWLSSVFFTFLSRVKKYVFDCFIFCVSDGTLVTNVLLLDTKYKYFWYEIMSCLFNTCCYSVRMRRSSRN